MGKWGGENVGTTPTDPLTGEKDKSTDGRVVRFEDLRIWQTARELARGIYHASRTQKLCEDRALAGQMKRAVVSISSNIAEGYERGTRKQQIEFCYIAKGSAGELRSQVIVAHDVGLLDDRAYSWCMEFCEKCSRQLTMYIRHLQRTQKRVPGLKQAIQEECRVDQ